MFPEAFSAEFGSGGKVPGVGEGQSAFFSSLGVEANHQIARRNDPHSLSFFLRLRDLDMRPLNYSYSSSGVWLHTEYFIS